MPERCAPKDLSSDCFIPNSIPPFSFCFPAPLIFSSHPRHPASSARGQFLEHARRKPVRCTRREWTGRSSATFSLTLTVTVTVTDGVGAAADTMSVAVTPSAPLCPV
jgi:hypothetical protein